jgi:pyrroline-5-carboxylate reductase
MKIFSQAVAEGCRRRLRIERTEPGSQPPGERCPESRVRPLPVTHPGEADVSRDRIVKGCLSWWRVAWSFKKLDWRPIHGEIRDMTLGIIGCGKMGRALLGGILEAGIVTPTDVHVYDAYPGAVAAAAGEWGVHAAESNAAVVARAETVLLCVKPQTFPGMLGELGETRGRLLISIAAGIRLAAMEAATGGLHRIVRVMPNTPALVGRGAAAYALGVSATEADAGLTEALLGSVGYVTRVTEDLIDAVTAVSGSGPAYVFLLVESMVRAGVELGLDERTALDLSIHTVAGAAELLLRTGESPAQLRENVTSPNGTTFAALESFRANGFDRIVHEALRAARDRSVELGNG